LIAGDKREIQKHECSVPGGVFHDPGSRHASIVEVTKGACDIDLNGSQRSGQRDDQQNAGELNKVVWQISPHCILNQSLYNIDDQQQEYAEPGSGTLS
jgi:hypothetical protein